VTSSAKRDLPASVKARLLGMARLRSEEFQRVVVMYALERLLYRLSRSGHSSRYILKGAMLVAAWKGGPYRPTKDLDLLCMGDNSPGAQAEIFRQLARTKVEPDGLVFDPGSVSAQRIIEGAEHPGVRIHLTAHLGKARIPLQVDIGFGDPVTPEPLMLELPVLLDFPAPQVRAYPPETVVAEKYEALVRLGLSTGRIKDFYDLWYLATHFAFEGPVLQHAIRNTFGARLSLLPIEPPIALTDEFEADPSRQQLWKAFTRRAGVVSAGSLGETLALLRTFLLPVGLQSAGRVPDAWTPGGPWHDRERQSWAS
jgi:predicted nucleotidyltransferase component of viral defense system